MTLRRGYAQSSMASNRVRQAQKNIGCRFLLAIVSEVGTISDTSTGKRWHLH